MMKIILALLFSLPAFGLSDVDVQFLWTKNILKNPGFENGKQNWSSSAGSFSIATVSAKPTFWLDGKVSGMWDAAADTNTLTSASVSIPLGLYGRNGVVACKIVVPSGTATHTVEAYDGSTVLGSVTITSSTTPTYTFTNFIFPGSGSIRARIQAHANEPAIGVDSCIIADASEINLTNISQATFVGSAYIAATTNCGSWSRTNAALGAVSSDTDCPGPTVLLNPGPGIIQTTDTDLPKFTVNNLPPGNYRVFISTKISNSDSNSSAAINDGTSTSGYCQLATATAPCPLEGTFTYTTAGNRTFELFIASPSGTGTVQNGGGQGGVMFSIYHYPLSSEQAYRPEMVPFYWSGYHDTTCSWAYSATTLATPTADATCSLTQEYNYNAGSITTLGAALPGIVFTAPQVGLYKVCAELSLQASASHNTGFRMVNGTSSTTGLGESSYNPTGVNATNVLLFCGIFSSTSVGTTFNPLIRGVVSAGSETLASVATFAPTWAIRWTVEKQNQPIPAPLLVNSVTSPVSGVMRIFSMKFAGGNPPTITRNDGPFGYTSRSGAGGYLWSITAGTCSTVPNCTVSCAPNNGTSICFIETDSTGAAAHTRTTTAFHTLGGVASSGSDSITGDVMCMCQK